MLYTYKKPAFAEKIDNVFFSLLLYKRIQRTCSAFTSAIVKKLYIRLKIVEKLIKLNFFCENLMKFYNFVEFE